MEFKNIEIPIYLQDLMRFAQIGIKHGYSFAEQKKLYKQLDKARLFLEILLSDNLVKIISERVESEFDEKSN